jgi:hypothetical protein
LVGDGEFIAGGLAGGRDCGEDDGAEHGLFRDSVYDRTAGRYEKREGYGK